MEEREHLYNVLHEGPVPPDGRVVFPRTIGVGTTSRSASVGCVYLSLTCLIFLTPPPLALSNSAYYLYW